jgi:hypothetical protein
MNVAVSFGAPHRYRSRPDKSARGSTIRRAVQQGPSFYHRAVCAEIDATNQVSEW